MAKTKFEKRALTKTIAKFPVGSIFIFCKGPYQGTYYEIEKHFLWDCNKARQISQLLEAAGPVVLTLNCRILAGRNKRSLHGFTSDLMTGKYWKAKLIARTEMMDNRVLTLSEFIESEIQKLRAFETQWEQDMLRRSPDEMPLNAYQATQEVWRERYDESR